MSIASKIAQFITVAIFGFIIGMAVDHHADIRRQELHLPSYGNQGGRICTLTFKAERDGTCRFPDLKEAK